MTDEERQRYEYERAHRAAQAAETWAVVDEAGERHEVAVSEGRTGAPPWVAHVADGTARRSLTSARDAVVMMAQARKWSIAEVLAPGQETAARAARAALADAFARGADLQRGLIRAFATSADPAEIDAVMSPTVPDDLGAELHARRLLDGVREALGPTCADATHEALPGLVAEVVACDAEMHREVDEQRDRLREMAAEVAHLEARRGALLAEVDRLAARDRDAGVVIEDLRKMLATARLDGAREMRERAALLEALAADSPADIIDAIRALPLPGEEVARG